MTKRVIRLLPEQTHIIPVRPQADGLPEQRPLDQLQRPLRDLRISVTDRCNFRCTYCMPKTKFGTDYPFLSQAEFLSFDEITRVARAVIDLGVEKIRLTGGEPLLRKNIERLIEQLATLTTLDGTPIDLTLTTNGAALAQRAAGLKQAGLQRVTVSLDALDDATFARMNDVDYPVHAVLAGIDAAANVGLAPVKINMVVQRGVNDHQIVPMARHFKGSGHILRFIEFMDVGTTNGWRLASVVPSAQVIERIHAELPLESVDQSDMRPSGEVAQRWQYRDGSGEIGVVSSVTRPFCQECTRVRLSADGKIYLCLFATKGHDVRPWLRDAQCSEKDFMAALAQIWQNRTDRYSEQRHQTQQTQTQRIEMSYIGG